MKMTVYMRVAKSPRSRDGYKVDASTTPRHQPLMVGTSYDSQPLHTLRFILKLDVPDDLLRPGAWPVVEVALTEDEVVRVPITVEAVSG